MLKLLVVPVLLLVTLAPTSPNCACKKFPFVTGAEYGHMTTTVFDEKPVNKIQGRITDRAGAPVSNAKVYVWRWPHKISEEESSSTNQKFDEYKNRLVACETGVDGRFCFNGLQAGKYRVCATGPAFNSTCVLIRLRTKSRRTGFDVVLDPGT